MHFCHLIYVKPWDLQVTHAQLVGETSFGKSTLNLLTKDSEIDKLKTLSVISGLSIFCWRF
jgi:hypothetical protein